MRRDMTRLTRVTPPRVRRAARPAPRSLPHDDTSGVCRACVLRFIRLFFNFGKAVSSRRIISYCRGLYAVRAARAPRRFTPSGARTYGLWPHAHAQCTHAHANTPSHGHTRTHKCVQAYAPSNSCLALTRCAAIPALGDPTAYTALRSRIDQSGHYDGRRIRWSSGVLRSPRAALPPPSYVAAVAFGALARVCPLPTLSGLALYCTGTDRVSPLISETAVLLGSV